METLSIFQGILRNFRVEQLERSLLFQLIQLPFFKKCRCKFSIPLCYLLLGSLTFVMKIIEDLIS